jgi:ubiquinone/menaquinone biosynthesis C-methylase UbiE
MSEKEKREVRDGFTRRAPSYGISEDHLTGVDLEYIEVFLHEGNVSRALDISTGAGHTAALIAKYCDNVVALDLSPGMLRESRKRYGSRGIHFVLGDAERLPFQDKSFSMATCRIAPHHYSDVRAFLRELARVLEEGGHGIIVDSIVPEDPELGEFMNRMETLRDHTHKRSFTFTEWENHFKECGLLLIESRKFRKTHHYSSWLSRTDPPAGRRRELAEMILRSKPKVLRYFDFELSGGEISYYTDDKAIFLVRH